MSTCRARKQYETEQRALEVKRIMGLKGATIENLIIELCDECGKYHFKNPMRGKKRRASTEDIYEDRKSRAAGGSSDD